MDSVDVVIVGAGAAGLEAARMLRADGMRVRVLEARDRIGGRILTHQDPEVPAPMELGAEFVHGEAPVTTELLREAGLAAVDFHGEHRELSRGRLRRLSFESSIAGVLERI